MTTFIIITIWLLSALVAVTIAHFKKLSVKSWIIVGVLLGPFAVAFVLSQDTPPSDGWRAGGYGGGASGGGAGCGGGYSCGGGGGCGGGAGG